MSVVTIHKAKTHLSRLIREAAKGKEIIIARGAKPVARLVAITEEKPQRKPGSWRGKFEVGPEFFEPLSQDELDAWES